MIGTLSRHFLLFFTCLSTITRARNLRLCEIQKSSVALHTRMPIFFSNPLPLGAHASVGFCQFRLSHFLRIFSLLFIRSPFSHSDTAFYDYLPSFLLTEASWAHCTRSKGKKNVNKWIGVRKRHSFRSSALFCKCWTVSLYKWGKRRLARTKKKLEAK